MIGLSRRFRIAGLVGVFCAQISAAALAPNLKVLLCTGDYGLYGQDRVPAIKNAVEKAAPGAVAWETHQSYNMTRALESPNYVGRFDVIVIGDVAMGQLTTKAQQNVVDFVKRGGGLVWVAWFKGGSAYSGEEAAVPMPLKNISFRRSMWVNMMLVMDCTCASERFSAVFIRATRAAAIFFSSAMLVAIAAGKYPGFGDFSFFNAVCALASSCIAVLACPVCPRSFISSLNCDCVSFCWFFASVTALVSFSFSARNFARSFTIDACCVWSFLFSSRVSLACLAS